MKKEAGFLIGLGIFFNLFLMSSVSAFSSASDFLSGIDPVNMILGVLFVVFFGLINFSLVKFFKNKAISAVLGLAISILAVWGLNQVLDFDNLFFSLGISYSTLSFVFLFLISVFSLIVLVKFISSEKRTLILLFLGIIFMAVGFLEIFDVSSGLISVGVLFLIFAIISWRLRKWKLKKARKSAKTFNVNLKGWGKKKDSDETVIDSQGESEKIQKLTKRIIKEAKIFRSLVDREKNPKFYRNWAGFIGYLKRRGYGGSAKEISKNTGLTESEIIAIVKKYIL